MESTKSNETLNEGAKAVENAFNNTNAVMTDMYKKQMDLTTSFYNNLFGSKLGNTNTWNQNSGFPNIFSNNMDMTKWFSNPFANFSATGMQNPFSSPLEKTMKQMTEFSQNLLSAFSGKGNNMGAMSEEYKETMETRLEASKEIFNTISEAFKKQLESSMETNKKVTEEMNTQFHLIMKQNQKLWADLLNTFQTPLNSEDKKSKDQIMYDGKKRSNVLATDFKDHKG